MSTSTTQLFPPDFFPKIIAAAEAQVAEWIGITFKSIGAQLLPYWPYIVGGLFLLLVIASTKALLGKAGALGSILYHIFYFAILGLIIWIKGPEIFFNPLFDLICFAVYRFCYWLVGLMLQKFR